MAESGFVNSPPPYLFTPRVPRTAMAQSFNGTSQYSSSAYLLTLTTNQTKNGAISVGFWLNWTTYGNNDHLALEYSPNYNTNQGGFLFDPNSSSPDSGSFDVGLSMAGNNTNLTIAGFTRPAAGVWNHILALFDGTKTGAAQIPAIFVNGASQALTYGVTTGVAGAFGGQTLYAMSRAGTTLFAAGAMSDLVIYRNLLTPADAVALASGADPRSVHRAGTELLYYWTLSFLHPEWNLGWNTGNMTTHTTAAVPAPSILSAQARQSNLLTQLKGGVVPGGTGGVGSLGLMGVGH